MSNVRPDPETPDPETPLMTGKKLSVTGLGRTFLGDSYEKHHIKKADRLIGNPYLNIERHDIYSALARLAFGRYQQPVIHVDWSDLTQDRELHWLRATVPVGGRALPIYEESHRRRDYAKLKVEKRFFLIQTFNMTFDRSLASSRVIIDSNSQLHNLIVDCNTSKVV